MPTPPPSFAPQPKRRVRKFHVVLVLGAALALSVWFLRARLLERVATALARSQAGLDVRFEGLELESLSVARATRIVAAARGETGALRYASIEGLEIDLDVRGLWSAYPLIDAVRADAARLRLDTSAAGAPEEPADEPFELRLPQSWPAVDIGSADVEIQGGETHAELNGARIALAARPGSATLNIDARELALSTAAPRGGDSTFAGAFHLVAAVDGTTLRVRRARWDGVAEIRAASFAPREGGGFDARLDLATRLGSADLDARSDGSAVAVRGSLADVDLRGVLRLLGVEADAFGGSWTARGSFFLPFADPGRWTADADVVAREPKIADRTADRIWGRFLATARNFEVAHAIVLAGANAVDAELVRIPRDADLGCEFLERATVLSDADLADVEAVLGDAWELPIDAPPHRVRARAELADGWLQVDYGRAEIGASTLELAAVRLPLDAAHRIVVLDPSTEFAIGIQSPDSAELARLVLPSEIAAELGLAGELSGSARLRTTEQGVFARLALRARDARIRGVSIDELTARAGFEAGRLEIERLDVRAGSTFITATGDVNLRTGTFAGLDVEADVPDLRDLGRALGLGAEALPLGSASVRARLDGPLVAPEGTLSLEAEDIQLGGIDIAWVRAQAHGEGGGIVVDDLVASVPEAGTITAAGSATRGVEGTWTCAIGTLDLEALEGSAKLARPVRVAIGRGGIAIDHLSLAGGEGALRLSASISDDELCADVAVDRAHIGRILRAFRVPVPASLRADGRANLALNGLGTDALDGSLDVALAVAVDDLSDLSLPHGFTASGEARARIQAGGTWREAQGVLELEAHGLGIHDAAGQPRLAGAEVEARADVGKDIAFESIVLRLPRAARITAGGRVGVALDIPAWSRGEFADVSAAPIDLDLHVDAPDLRPLADAFEVLRRTGGSLAADLKLTGTAADPSIAGRVLMRDGAVKLSATLPAISGVEVDLALDGTHIGIDRAVGVYGGGEITLAGTVELAEPGPVLDLAIHGSSVPIVRSAEMSVRSDVDVRVTGAWDALELAGTAALHDARFEQRLDLDRLRTLFESKPGGAGGGALELPSITEAPFGAMRLRLDVRSDGPVRVRTPLLRAQVVTRFTIRGTGAIPLLDGSLELEGGRIALPASKLDLARGRVDFDPNDPGRARLDVTAEGRVSGYDVSARVTGTTDDPVIELSSIPPASQEDLALLLLAGRLPGSRGLALDQDRVVGEVATYVARDLAYEWFGDAGESFADRLELSTGADVTQSGADTIEVRFRLTGPARGPGLATYLRGERDIYDRVNMGIRFVFRVP